MAEGNSDAHDVDVVEWDGGMESVAGSPEEGLRPERVNRVSHPSALAQKACFLGGR